MCVKILSTSQDILGLAAFKCQAYTRALMYLEMFLSANGSAINDHLAFLQVRKFSITDIQCLCTCLSVCRKYMWHWMNLMVLQEL